MAPGVAVRRLTAQGLGQVLGRGLVLVLINTGMCSLESTTRTLRSQSVAVPVPVAAPAHVQSQSLLQPQSPSLHQSLPFTRATIRRCSPNQPPPCVFCIPGGFR